jgi:hypothetical protein
MTSWNTLEHLDADWRQFEHPIPVHPLPPEVSLNEPKALGIIDFQVPTLIREAGFEVRIYTLDHPPPHVHVAKGGAIVKIDLSTHHAIEIVGAISDRDVKRAETLVARNAQFLRLEWEKLHARR